MATPTLIQIRNISANWWRQPGPLRLDTLSAQVAALWTDVSAAVRVRIEYRAGPVQVVVVDLDRAGTVTTYEWTPPVDERPETLADVVDPARGGLSERDAHVPAVEERV